MSILVMSSVLLHLNSGGPVSVASWLFQPLLPHLTVGRRVSCSHDCWLEPHGTRKLQPGSIQS